ncbi:MAG: mannonate dehydratase [Bryobacteraceae bacterium]
MSSPVSRRDLIRGLATASIAAVATDSSVAAEDIWKRGPGMPTEGPNTPKIGAPVNGRDLSDGAIRPVRQLGVEYVLTGGGPMPWSAEQLSPIVHKLNAGGLKLGNMMISGFPNTIYGKPGRDDEIAKFKASIEAAGKVGLPVIEYNFYAHRAMEGYYEETGRAGAGLTAFDYDRMKNLPPLPAEGTYTVDQLWENIRYFLKAVIPVAEKSDVRLALHPNDPPVALSRGSGQIISTVDGWKKLVSLVNSPSNGITFDCGVTRETGHDPVEVCRYFGSRDRINHVHYRNVRVREPYNKYTETFIDEGENNMLAVMQELVKQKYTRMVYPEHERALDYDRAVGIHNQYPGGGGYTGMAYDIAYARAMLQASLLLAKS